MNKYELVTVLDANSPQEEKETVVKEAAEIIKKYKGKVINNRVWVEKNKFSFRLKKRNEGTYYLTNFEMPGEMLSPFRNELRLSDKILRSSVIRGE